MAKPEPGTVNILDALCEHQDFHSSIFLTYGADLTFFENAILPMLWDKGCRRNFIIMDAERYADTLDDLRGGVSKVGQRYLVVPIRLGRFQAFHPKQILLLGTERARLLVGSGNLTFTGYGHNHEVFTCVDWTPDQPEWEYLCVQAWRVIKAIMQKWGHAKEAKNMIQRIEQLSLWLTHSLASSSTEIQLFHSLDKPLLQQIRQALDGEDIQKITVVAPFLDQHATALSAFYDYFRPKTVQLVLQDYQAVGNTEALEKLLKSGNWLKIHHFQQVNDEQRYLHAKIYIFETADAAYAVTGSANCSQAALLSSGTEGNIEIVLLRRGSHRHHFADLLKDRIHSQPVASLENISLKPADISPPEREGEKVQLFDLSIENGKLVVSYTVNSLPKEVVTLQLRISTTPPEFISLGPASNGPHTIEVAMADKLQKVMVRPQSATIWGIDSAGQLVDLDCNELWITHVDILRLEIARVTPVDIGAGDTITAGVIESENEWRELCETILKLVELDVAQLKRRKGGYSSQKSGGDSGSGQNRPEKETQVLLMDSYDEDETAEQREIEEKNFKDSDFGRWFEYIRTRLPGTQQENPADDDEDLEDDLDNITDPDEQAGIAGTNGKKKNRTGHKWTPSEHEGRRFTNLVRKYIASLNNDEYMQIASIRQKITYYIVFQRIIWLLFEHKVIDPAGFIDFACQINAGLFGSPDEDPPALCARLRPHLRSVWRREWEAYEMSTYVLASLFIVNGLLSQIDDEDLRSQIERRSVWILAGLTGVAGLQKFDQSNDVHSQLAAWYHEDEVGLILQAEKNYLSHLADINRVLDRWSQKVTIALEAAKDAYLRKLLLQARIDYGQARYHILNLLENIEEQTNLCSDLIFWTRYAGDEEKARQYGEHLILLLQAQGLSHNAAESLFKQGQHLFLGSDIGEAIVKLQQASVLAKQIDNKMLLEKCERYLGYCRFRLDLQKKVETA